jgi:hypothetical protein
MFLLILRYALLSVLMWLVTLATVPGAGALLFWLWPHPVTVLLAPAPVFWLLVAAVLLAKPEGAVFSPGAGGIQRLYRLPRWAAWLETFDEHDGRLPAGLYERQVRWVHERLGWRVAALYWLTRNTAYRLRTRWQYHTAPGDALTTGGEGRMEPFRAGVWWCVAWRNRYVHNPLLELIETPPRVDAVPVAFELSITWPWPLVRKAAQVRLGWKLRPLAEGFNPPPDSAVGLPMPPQIRPTQSRVDA